MRSGVPGRGMALAVGVLLAVAACGGGGDSPGTDAGASPGPPAGSLSGPSAGPTAGPSAEPSAGAGEGAGAARPEIPGGLPTAVEPLERTVEDFAEALRTGRCERIGVFVTDRQRDPDVAPGATPDAKECRELERFLNPLGAFRPGAHQEFGTAAVVDGTLNGALATTVWVLDPDRHWRIDPTAYVYPTPEDPDVHSVGTAPRPGNRFAENARAWVRAWRTGKCADAYRLTDPFSAFVADNGGTEDGFCRVVTESFTGDGIGRMLTDNPDAEPTFLGAVDQYGFSLLRTSDGSLFTIVSIVQATNASPAERTAHDNYGVYNIYRARVGEKATDGPGGQPSGRPQTPS